MYKLNRKLLTVLLSTLFLFMVCHSGNCKNTPLTLINNGKSQCVIVINEKSPTEKFAAKELTEIVKGTTGVNLRTVDIKSPEAKNAQNRIIVGRNKLTEELLGKQLMDSLKEQESLVTSRGKNLILTGGDDWGMIYAVYDFVENEAGYRCYAPYPGGERFVKSDKLIYSGKETKRKPAFPAFRLEYTSGVVVLANRKTAPKYYFRNRATNLDWKRYGRRGKDVSYANHIGLKEKFKSQALAQHALSFYVSADDRRWVFWKKGGLKGSFKEHPEYFTMNKAGKRVPNAQLCFSNPELRKSFTQRVIKAVKAKGAGIYMVGSNDNHRGTYCFCPGCQKLVEKYNSNGGPLWDYLKELCETLKPLYPDVYITSLAYKGVRQTELAPDNIIFPDNFVCDAGILNTYTPISQTRPLVLKDGKEISRYDNLKKWNKIAKYVTYWFYGGSSPLQTYGRQQQEFRDLRNAGVDGVGVCSPGGGIAFRDISDYLCFRLMLNPDIDARSVVKEQVEFKYGAAAPLMMQYIDDLEATRRKAIKNDWQYKFKLWVDDTWEKTFFVTPEQILRWQKNFDKMLDLVKNDPVRSRNVRIARVGVDVWTTYFFLRIKEAYPDAKIDLNKVIDRGLRACGEAEKAGMVLERRNLARRAFQELTLYAHIKDDSIPTELKKYPEDKIIRHLTPRKMVRNKIIKDADAVTGYAMKAKVSEKKKFDTGVKFVYYDAMNKKWVFNGEIPLKNIVPNKYKLYKLKTGPVTNRCNLVIAGLWPYLNYDLGRHFDPNCQERQYEFWISLKFEGPKFDPKSKAKDSYISTDQIFLINKGTKE